MASQAFAKKTRFKAKAKQKGFRITVTRPSKMNVEGTAMTTPLSVDYMVIEDSGDSDIKYRITKILGVDNQSNDRYKAFLFPWDADVREGDELNITNTSYTYTVTSADNPFQIGSEVVYWQVQCTRKSK